MSDKRDCCPHVLVMLFIIFLFSQVGLLVIATDVKAIRKAIEAAQPAESGK